MRHFFKGILKETEAELDRLQTEKKQLREEIEIRKRLQDPGRKSKCIPMLEDKDDLREKP
jgi:hypothetical protein